MTVGGDVLHDRDGALTHERDRHRIGADALARYAAGGVGGVEEGRGGQQMIRFARRKILLVTLVLFAGLCRLPVRIGTRLPPSGVFLR